MIRMLGYSVGCILGTILSPSWILLRLVLKDYFDIDRALSGVLPFLTEMNQYSAICQNRPEEVLYQVLPMVLASLILGSLFVAGCGHLGARLFTGWFSTRPTAGAH